MSEEKQLLVAEVENEIKNITSQLIEKYKPEKIILFGSYVWGDFNSDSDLDFLLIKNDAPYLGRDRIRELYGIIEKNIAVDFFVYKPSEIDEAMKHGDPFLGNAISKGKVLYG